MTNLEAVFTVLTRHIDARQWTTDAVARDVVRQLGLDPMGGVGAMAAADKAKADADHDKRNAEQRDIAAAYVTADEAKKAAVDGTVWAGMYNQPATPPKPDADTNADVVDDMADDMAVDKARTAAQEKVDYKKSVKTFNKSKAEKPE